MSYDHWKTTNPADEYPTDEYLEDNEQCDEQLPICEHCHKFIKEGEDFIHKTGYSGPSEHHLFFHTECWTCPICGTNGPHYCPADIARS
jgi:hypothetical protein